YGVAGTLGIRQFSLNPFSVDTSADQLFFDLPSCLGISVDYYRERALLRSGVSDGSTDALGPSGDEDDFILQLQVHGAPLSARKSVWRSARRFCPALQSRNPARIPRSSAQPGRSARPEGRPANPSQTSRGPRQTAQGPGPGKI